VPPVAVQVTALLVEFVTVAVNCRVPLGESDAGWGDAMLSALTVTLASRSSSYPRRSSPSP
jgi:hypothetical protein